MAKSVSSPDKTTFLMPAEWEPHAATWLAWPHFHGDWPGKFEPIPWVYAEIIRNLSRHERVELIVKDAAAERLARKTLKRGHALNDNVGFRRWATNRVWTRDSGCAFVRRNPGAKAPTQFGQPDAGPETLLHPKARSTQSTGQSSGSMAAIKWRFNAWAKYPNWRHDEKIGSLMAQTASVLELRPMFGKSSVVLEGGSIDVNGRGTLLTTEECLLSRVQQRNPGICLLYNLTLPTNREV
jgi:agmatine deiminase